MVKKPYPTITIGRTSTGVELIVCGKKYSIALPAEPLEHVVGDGPDYTPAPYTVTDPYIENAHESAITDAYRSWAKNIPPSERGNILHLLQLVGLEINYMVHALEELEKKTSS